MQARQVLRSVFWCETQLKWPWVQVIGMLPRHGMVGIRASKHTGENYGSPELAPIEVIVMTLAILPNFSENQVFRHQAKSFVGICV